MTPHIPIANNATTINICDFLSPEVRAAAGSGGLSSFLWLRQEWPPLQGRDHQRRTLARANPAGRGQFERAVERIRLAAVSHDQCQVLIDWSGVGFQPNLSENRISLAQPPGSSSIGINPGLGLDPVSRGPP
jgi:hypothetical protein